MAQVRVGIALPEEVLSEIDELAEKNFSNRSHTIVRVWLEWKAAQGKKTKTSTTVTPPTRNEIALTANAI